MHGSLLGLNRWKIYFACGSGQEARKGRGGNASRRPAGVRAARDPSTAQVLALRQALVPLRMTGRLLRQGAASLPGGCGFVVRGVEDYAAVEAFAVAFGAEVGLVAEGEVDDAALARGHGS